MVEAGWAARGENGRPFESDDEEIVLASQEADKGNRAWEKEAFDGVINQYVSHERDRRVRELEQFEDGGRRMEFKYPSESTRGRCQSQKQRYLVRHERDR